jgi:hypothetical protein
MKAVTFFHKGKRLAVDEMAGCVSSHVMEHRKDGPSVVVPWMLKTSIRNRCRGLPVWNVWWLNKVTLVIAVSRDCNSTVFGHRLATKETDSIPE